MGGAGIRAGAVAFAVAMLIVASGTDCPECTDFDWFATWLIMMFFLYFPYLAVAFAVASLASLVWVAVALVSMSRRAGPSEREAGGMKASDGLD